MSARLQATLDDLRDETGATAADLTADELEALVLACRRVDSPYSEINADLMGRPVRVSRGVFLWPITAGAQVWLSEFAAKWWRKDSSAYAWARVYALAHARDSEAFATLTTPFRARLAILKTALRLACSARELARAVALCYGSDPNAAPIPNPDRAPKNKSLASADFAALVARLEVASGIPAHDWLWGRSLVSLAKSYVELDQLSAALGGATKPRRIELDEAVTNLARTCAAISSRLRQIRNAQPHPTTAPKPSPATTSLAQSPNPEKTSPDLHGCPTSPNPCQSVTIASPNPPHENKSFAPTPK